MVIQVPYPLVGDYNLVALGGRGVGKTALAIRCNHGYFSEENDYIIQDTHRKQIVVDEGIARVDVFDIPCLGEDYSPWREGCMRMAEGFLLIYSITSRESIEELDTYHQQVLRFKGQDPFPVIVVASKCDLEFQREVGTDEGRGLAKHFGYKFIETSAKYGVNIDEALSAIVREIRKYNKEQEAGRLALTGNEGGSPGANDAKDQYASGCSTGCLVL